MGLLLECRLVLGKTHLVFVQEIAEEGLLFEVVEGVVRISMKAIALVPTLILAACIISAAAILTAALV